MLYFRILGPPRSNKSSGGFTSMGVRIGGLYDSVTGLTRFGVRDYDPYLGRWLTQDSLGFAAGDTNLYRYVYGSPLSLVDVDGREPITVALLVAFIVGATVGLIAADLTLGANQDCYSSSEKISIYIASGVAGGLIAVYAAIPIITATLAASAAAASAAAATTTMASNAILITSAISIAVESAAMIGLGLGAAGLTNVVKDMAVSSALRNGSSSPSNSMGAADVVGSFLGGMSAYSTGLVAGVAGVVTGGGIVAGAIFAGIGEAGGVALSTWTGSIGDGFVQCCLGP